MNNKKVLVEVMVGLIVLLLGVCVYLDFFNKEELKIDNINENDKTENNKKEETKYEHIDFNELVKSLENDDKKYRTSSSYEKISVKELPKTLKLSINDNDYTVEIDKTGVLKVNGKILDTEEDHTLVEKALDIASLAGEYSSKLFVIMTYGDVYEYSLENFDSGNTSIKKINEIKDASQFVKITKCYNKAGCDVLLGVIDKNNQYVNLDDFAV